MIIFFYTVSIESFKGKQIFFIQNKLSMEWIKWLNMIYFFFYKLTFLEEKHLIIIIMIIIEINTTKHY